MGLIQCTVSPPAVHRSLTTWTTQRMVAVSVPTNAIVSRMLARRRPVATPWSVTVRGRPGRGSSSSPGAASGRSALATFSRSARPPPLAGHAHVRPPLSARRHDARPQSQRLRGLPPPCPGLKRALLIVCQRHLHGSWSSHRTIVADQPPLQGRTYDQDTRRSAPKPGSIRLVRLTKCLHPQKGVRSETVRPSSHAS
jgi:hypothetical protein